jgi:hypothetical protein
MACCVAYRRNQKDQSDAQHACMFFCNNSDYLNLAGHVDVLSINEKDKKL